MDSETKKSTQRLKKLMEENPPAYYINKGKADDVEDLLQRMEQMIAHMIRLFASV